LKKFDFYFRKIKRGRKVKIKIKNRGGKIKIKIRGGKIPKFQNKFRAV